MKKFLRATSIATVGAALSLMSVSTAEAAVLQAQVNISGTVDGPIGSGTEISSSLGVNAGDIITGSYTLSYDDSIFNTTSDFVNVGLRPFSLFVGSQTLVPISPSSTFRNPAAQFARVGESFVFNTTFGVFSYLTPSGFNSFARLMGGIVPYGNPGEGILFTSEWTSSPEIAEIGDEFVSLSSPGGVTQTCQGQGCRFPSTPVTPTPVTPTPVTPTPVPETTPTLGLLALGFLGIGLLSKQRKLIENQ